MEFLSGPLKEPNCGGFAALLLSSRWNIKSSARLVGNSIYLMVSFGHILKWNGDGISIKTSPRNIIQRIKHTRHSL